MPYEWKQAAEYMAALHDLKHWVNKELDRAQLMEPLSETLPQAWDKVEKTRGELLRG